MPSNPKKLFDDHYLEWADDFKLQAEKKGVVLTEEKLKTLILIDLKNQSLVNLHFIHLKFGNRVHLWLNVAHQICLSQTSKSMKTLKLKLILM